MKNLILFLVCFGLFYNVVFSQNNEKIDINDFKKDAQTFKNYLDPAFPDVSKITNPQDPTMADYVKQHPQIPLISNTGNKQNDQIYWEAKVNEWFAKYPYFPQFMEYHKYNYLLKPEDDVIFYNTAKTEWIKRNPDKVKQAFNESEK